MYCIVARGKKNNKPEYYITDDDELDWDFCSVSECETYDLVPDSFKTREDALLVLCSIEGKNTDEYTFTVEEVPT